MNRLKSPYTLALVVVFGVFVWIAVATPPLETRINVFFITTLLLMGSWFQSLRTDTSVLSDNEREKLGKRWEQEVARAKRHLADYAKVVSAQGKHWREWNETEEKRYWDFLEKGSEFAYLFQLAQDFRREQHKEMLRKWWECAEEQSVERPTLDELWRMK